MLYTVLAGKGLGGNVLKGGDRTAASRQTQEEHDNLLDIKSLPGYSRFLAMPPGPAKTLALKALEMEAEEQERTNPKWWMDERPRREITQSSSFINGVSVDPNSGMGTVQIKDRIYLYPMTTQQATEFVNSDDLGRYFNNVLLNK